MPENSFKHFFTFAQHGDNVYADKHGKDPLPFQLPREIMVLKISIIFLHSESTCSK